MAGRFKGDDEECLVEEDEIFPGLLIETVNEVTSIENMVTVAEKAVNSSTTLDECILNEMIID